MNRNGLLVIEASCEGSRLQLSVTNTGVGLLPVESPNGSGKGVGLSNVKDRLLVHYGDDQSFSIREIENNTVQVLVTLPLQYALRPTEKLTGYGA